jgi:hypothetical protein
VEHVYQERGHNHRIAFVPRVDHDHATMWGSSEGLLQIFAFWAHGAPEENLP